MIGRGSARSIVPAARLLARFPVHKQNFPATRGNIALLCAETTPNNLESLTLSASKVGHRLAKVMRNMASVYLSDVFFFSRTDRKLFVIW